MTYTHSLSDASSQPGAVRRTRLWKWLVLAIVAGAGLSFVHERPLYMGDTLSYVTGAESLAHLEGYTVEGKPMTTWPYPLLSPNGTRLQELAPI